MSKKDNASDLEVKAIQRMVKMPTQKTYHKGATVPPKHVPPKKK